MRSSAPIRPALSPTRPVCARSKPRREAYRVGAAEEDAAQLRRDVIEYLARPDALQRARVERAAEVLEAQ